MRFAAVLVVVLLGSHSVNAADPAADTPAIEKSATTTVAPTTLPECTPKPPPIRRPTVVTTPRLPSAPGQNNEINVYCGDTTQNQGAGSSNEQGKTQKGDGANKPPEKGQEGGKDIQKVPTNNEIEVSLKDMKFAVKSANPWIFGITILGVAIFFAILIWYVTPESGSAKVPSADNRRRTAFALFCVAIFCVLIWYVYPKDVTSLAECRARTEAILASKSFQESLAGKVDAKVRGELEQCTRRAGQLEIDNRVLQATSESWPVSRWVPYAMFGFAIGLLIGMFFTNLISVLWSLRSSQIRKARLGSDDYRRRKELLRELQNELEKDEIETLKEWLDTRRRNRPPRYM